MRVELLNADHMNEMAEKYNPVDKFGWKEADLVLLKEGEGESFGQHSYLCDPEPHG
jgi:hypothetical protein